MKIFLDLLALRAWLRWDDNVVTSDEWKLWFKLLPSELIYWLFIVSKDYSWNQKLTGTSKRDSVS